MKTVFAAIALFVAAAVADNPFQINTPSNVEECEPTLVSWSGGTAPYYLNILPGSSPDGAAIESFPAINATSVTWQCNIASGTSIGFTLRDSNGNIAQSAAVTVNPGSGDTCLSSTFISAAGSTGSSSSGASATASGATTTPTSAGTTAASSTSAGASASPTSTGTSSSSGASSNVAQLGAAAMAGVAVVALFL